MYLICFEELMMINTESEIYMIIIGRYKLWNENTKLIEFVETNKIKTMCSINQKNTIEEEFIKKYNSIYNNHQEYIAHDALFAAAKKRLIDPNTVNNVLSMFYNQNHIKEYLKEYIKTKPAAIIWYNRIDLFLEDYSSIGKIIESQIEDDVIYIPFNTLNLEKNGSDYRGINDQMAIGNIKTMIKYLSVYPNILTYMNDVYFNPEILLKHHLKKEQIKIVRFKLPYYLHKNRRS